MLGRQDSNLRCVIAHPLNWSSKDTQPLVRTADIIAEDEGFEPPTRCRVTP